MTRSLKPRGWTTGVLMAIVLSGASCSLSDASDSSAEPDRTSNSSDADERVGGDDEATSGPAEREPEKEPAKAAGPRQLVLSSVTEKPGVLIYRAGTRGDADLQKRARVAGPIAYQTFGTANSGLVIVEADGSNPRTYSGQQGLVSPHPAWPGLLASTSEDDLLEWLDVATGMRLPRPENTLSELSGGYEIASVNPPGENQSAGLSGPRGPFEIDQEGWLPWDVQGSAVLSIAVDADAQQAFGAGAFAVSGDVLRAVHLFETPEGVSIFDVWLDLTGRSIFAMLTDGNETWIETAAFDRPVPRRLEFEGFSVDEEVIVGALSPDALALNVDGMMLGVDLSAGTVTEPVPFASVLREWHHGLMLWTDDGFAVMTTDGSYELLDIPTIWASPIRDREELDPEALWFGVGPFAFPFWVLNTATSETHVFDPAEDPSLEPSSPILYTAIGGDGRLYVTADEGMWILAPDGTHEFVDGAFGRLEMSPSGDRFVTTRITLVDGRQESLPAIIVVDLDGQVLAELGEGDFPIWTHGQP